MLRERFWLWKKRMNACLCSFWDSPQAQRLGGGLQAVALLLRRLRHHFSRETSSHPAPVPASRIDPDGPLLPPALRQRRFDIRTSERSTVLTFCSHSQLSRVFGRRGGEQSGRQLVKMPMGNLPSGLGVRASRIATGGEHADLGRICLLGRWRVLQSHITVPSSFLVGPDGKA